MSPARREGWAHLGLVIGAWAALVAVALLTRPLLPIDETRAASVAWEMWTSGNSLVPHLNGVPYPDKPPLVLWLYEAGWAVFGVNDWWPRLVSPLSALASLLLTLRLAHMLWPQAPGAARIAPLVLLGTVAWAFYQTLAMYDMTLIALILVALVGLVRGAGARPGAWAWVVYGAATGLGVLTKGPVVLLFVGPPALLAPLWAPPRGNARWAIHYAALLLSLGLAAAIALAWALPAARAGGEAYGRAIFWTQTAGRVENAFAHGRAWWWYLPLLPLLLFAWSLLPPLWRAIGSLGIAKDPAGRFLLGWIVPAFIALLAFSGKQAHYLLPLFPALALLAGRALAEARRVPVAAEGWTAALPVLVLGAALAASPLAAGTGALDQVVRLPAWAAGLAHAWGLVPAGLALFALGLALVLWRARETGPWAARWTIGIVAMVALIHLGASPVLFAQYDTRPVARVLKGFEAEGRPIAHFGNYDGQYQFTGRLLAPLTEVYEKDATGWARTHPGGVIVAYARRPPRPAEGAVLVHAYRGKYAVVWRADAFLAHASARRRR